jgi:hypothetical protein
MKYYYLLWSDVIFAFKNGPYKNDWKNKTAFIMAALMFLNIKTPFILAHSNYMWLNIDGWLEHEVYKNVLNAINWFLPFIILNYYFIFYKDKWKQIEKRYPHSNKRILKRYFLFSFFLGFGSVITQNLFDIRDLFR